MTNGNICAELREGLIPSLWLARLLATNLLNQAPVPPSAWDMAMAIGDVRSVNANQMLTIEPQALAEQRGLAEEEMELGMGILLVHGWVVIRDQGDGTVKLGVRAGHA